MNILLINTPSRKGLGGFMLPLGLLYVGGIVERCGHRARVVDPYLQDLELRDFDSNKFDYIDELIEDFEPTIVGYGGIATSYGRAKRLALHVKERHPNIVQIAGGALASVDELLLTRARVDAVFHGETEISLPIFLEKAEGGQPFTAVPGISFLSEGKIVRNAMAEQVKDLDTIPLPAYHLVGVPRYFQSVDDWLRGWKAMLEASPHYPDILRTIGNRKHCIPMVTSRGCTHRCLFCYRHVSGVRQHSVDYVIRHIKFLRDKYGVEGFQFCDELFNPKVEWVMEFCDALERERLNIFYMIGGARIDKVNEKMLRRLKETGCIEIGYGQESGSDAVLKEYRKGITSKQNRDITLLTKEVGLNCPVQLVIGSPGETTKTVYETIKFLKEVDARQYSLNYLIALPKTPIWDYVEKHKLVADVEAYLNLVAEQGGVPLLNLTKEPDRVWRNWSRIIDIEMMMHNSRSSDLKRYSILRPVLEVEKRISPFLPNLPKAMKRAAKRILHAGF